MSSGPLTVSRGTAMLGVVASHPTAATVARYVDVMLAAALFKPQPTAQVAKCETIRSQGQTIGATRHRRRDGAGAVA